MMLLATLRARIKQQDLKEQRKYATKHKVLGTIYFAIINLLSNKNRCNHFSAGLK